MKKTHNIDVLLRNEVKKVELQLNIATAIIRQSIINQERMKHQIVDHLSRFIDKDIFEFLYLR